MSASISSESQRDSRFGCNICLEPVVEPVVTLCGHLYCWPCLFRWLEPGMSELESRGLLGWTNQHSRHRPVDDSRRACPVCKTICSVSTVIPIYVRHQDDVRQPQSPIVGKKTVDASSTLTQEESGKLSDRERDDMEIVPTQPLSVDESNSNSLSEYNNTESFGQQQLRRRSRTAIPLRPIYSPSEVNPAHTSSRIPLPPPSPPPGSLSTSLVLSVQEALFGHHAVPSLHHPQQLQNETHRSPETEFLSRVLLLLGSFVILCLLLF